MSDYKDVALKHIEEAVDELRSRVKRLKEGQFIQLAGIQFLIPVPEDHTKDYDQVIEMLKMSVDEELEIESDQFACYVMDDWDWKEDFARAAFSNKTTATAYRSSK
jgi:hypothetical protein